MIDLINLRDYHCRYIVEDAFFCGARTQPGKSWCKEHGKIVYTPSKPRLRELEETKRLREAKREIG